jgi:putative nucleotidyltransferase with HDIG domain
MLSFDAMKSQTENELSALAAGILWITGAAMILTPSHLNKILDARMLTSIFISGIFCYEVALAVQRSFTRRVPTRQDGVLLLVCGLTLLAVSGLLIYKGLYIESFIMLALGVVQILLISKSAAKIKQADLLAILAPLLEFASGVYLVLNQQPYNGFELAGYRYLMAFLFFMAAAIGILLLYYPTIRFNGFLFRIQALPWLLWCLIFFPSRSIENIIAPAIFAAAILLSKTLPWHRLILPKDDVLGHRMMTVTSAIGLAMLVFLGGLLILIDGTIVPELENLLLVREATLAMFIMISAVLYYQVITIIMTINGLISELSPSEDESKGGFDLGLMAHTWSQRLARYLKPFTISQESVRTRLTSQSDQLTIISNHLANEKKRNKQLILLNELSQQLENQLDSPVSAQLAVNTLEQGLNSSLVSLYIYEPDTKDFILLASAGPQSFNLVSGYRQSMATGAIGRAARQRKTQIINDVRLDSDYIHFENESNLSCVIVPIISNGYVNGVIVLNDEKTNAFGSLEISLAESVAGELTRSWERSGYHKRLMDLIQSGSQLSSMVEPEATANEIAAITKDILQSRFTYVHIQLGQEESFIQTAFAGDAPKLLRSMETAKETDPLIQAAFRASTPFRVRDVRKYTGTSHLDIDQNSLRSMLAIPIRWHRLSIGVILAFGKQNEVFFSENDESLAELLSIQAAGAFESTWLQQELRASLRTTSLLYRLSTHIIQAENLQDAARDIAQTAHKLASANSTGIVLFSKENEIEAELEIDENGIHTGVDHPVDLIRQVMDSGQLIYMSHGKSMMRACLPIQTPIRKYGALWINIPDDHQHKPTNPADLQTLVNQAAIALERSILLVESRQQAQEIKAAYDMLEVTYDQTLASLTSALDARDRETEGHSVRVSRIAARLGETLNFSHEQLKVLERGSLLHDIGKIGISDTILHKPGPLNEDEWKVMRMHPEIGAQIVQGIPFLQDTISLIRHHQERWDGSGYPYGQKGEEIPLLARMFSVVDAFDALTSNRPYRQKITLEEAITYLHQQSGILFDPSIVEAFKKLVLENPSNFIFKE